MVVLTFLGRVIYWSAARRQARICPGCYCATRRSRRPLLAHHWDLFRAILLLLACIKIFSMYLDIYWCLGIIWVSDIQIQGRCLTMLPIPQRYISDAPIAIKITFSFVILVVKKVPKSTYLNTLRLDFQ